MELKKGEVYWFEQHRDEALKFLCGKKTEKELMDFHENNKSIYKFTLRALQQMEMRYLSLFLMKLSKKEHRRLFLMDPDFLGLNYKELEMILAVSANKINKFRKSENKTDEYGYRFLIHVALICRVPFHWIVMDKIQSNYECDPILYIEIPTLTKKSLLIIWIAIY